MLTKLDEKINEIKKSLLNESIDEDLFNKILACKSLDDLKEDKVVIEQFKSLSEEDSEKLMDKLFKKSIEGDKPDENLTLLYHYLKEINEK